MRKPSTTSWWLFPPATREVQLDEKWAFVGKKEKVTVQRQFREKRRSCGRRVFVAWRDGRTDVPWVQAAGCGDRRVEAASGRDRSAPQHQRRQFLDAPVRQSDRGE